MIFLVTGCVFSALWALRHYQFRHSGAMSRVYGPLLVARMAVLRNN